jgi:hypothetical protein
MKRRILVIIVAMVVAILPFAPALAATSAAVTVTYQPQLVAISINPTTWTINSETGNSKIATSTTYYSNPTSSITTPTVGGATDAQCAFTITNTSNVAIDLYVTASDASGGSDAMTNGETGSAGATSYGAKSYFSGQASGAWVVAKKSGSSKGLDNLAASTNIKTGMVIATQTDAWSGSTNSTLTITWTAVAH